MHSTKPLNSQQQQAILKLTALWALAESGIGGIMFALKIPLTGFVIGAIALIMLSLIASFSGNSFKHILGATLLVIAVKATVSPHSSPAAYVAVAFQGLSAALLFSTVRSHRLACILLGMLSMVESSLQKVLMMTLVFGKAIWEAVNVMAADLAKTYHLKTNENFALWLIGSYAFIHLLWGIFVGWKASGMPARLEAARTRVIEDYRLFQHEKKVLPEATKKKRRGKKLLVYALLLIAIILVLSFAGVGSKRIGFLILRSFAAIALLMVVVPPLLKWLMKKWLSNSKRQEEVMEVMEMLPGMRELMTAAYRMAAQEKGMMKRAGTFITTAILLALYADTE